MPGAHEHQPTGYDEYRGNIKKVGDLIEEARICMLTTKRADGTLITRPMKWALRDAFDGVLWFFTYDESRKADDIERDSHVNLGFLSNDQKIAVSIRGTAQIVHDRALIDELWQPELEAWFPDGKETDGLALLRVDATGAEYWDGTQNPIVMAFELARGIVGDKHADVGENAKLNLEAEASAQPGSPRPGTGSTV
jgi:general stress protein 26